MTTLTVREAAAADVVVKKRGHPFSLMLYMDANLFLYLAFASKPIPMLCT